MDNFNADRLLTMSPEEALLIRINEVLGISLNPRYVKIGDVIMSDGAYLDIVIKARDDNPEATQFVTGECVVKIERLDITEVFGPVVNVEYDGKISAYDIGRILEQRTGIVFDENDFIDQVITPVNNTLFINSISRRWFGQITVLSP
jgi:hypothetical protein